MSFRTAFAALALAVVALAAQAQYHDLRRYDRRALRRVIVVPSHR